VTRIATTQQIVASFDKWKDTVLIFDGYESSFSDAIVLTLEVEKLARFTRLDVIFEYSPSKLHKVLVTMISELQNVTKKEVFDEKDIDTMIKLLESVVSESKNRYSELSSSFARAAELIQTELAARSNTRDVWRVIQDMWRVFSLGLRAKENANINKKQVLVWEKKYALALSAFELQL